MGKKWLGKDDSHDIEDHIRNPRAQRRGSNILAFRVPYAFVPDGLYGYAFEYRV